MQVYSKAILEKKPKLSAAALDSAKNFTVGMGRQFPELTIHCEYTNSAATALVFTFEIDPGDGVYREVEEINTAAGTISQASISRTVSGDLDFSVGPLIFPKPAKNIRVTITGTSADASDTITVKTAVGA